MNKQNVLIAAAALLVGLFVGFFAANSINQSATGARVASTAVGDLASPGGREVSVTPVKEQPAALGGAAPGGESLPANHPPLAPSAGGGATPAAGQSGDEKPDVPTPELDAKIAAAEPKAKRANATTEEKQAAAKAFFERGYFYYTAQNPKLYKFALGDFRRSLRYQPDNEEARELVKQIEDIYRFSVNKPVPTNGLEP